MGVPGFPQGSSRDPRSPQRPSSDASVSVMGASKTNGKPLFLIHFLHWEGLGNLLGDPWWCIGDAQGVPGRPWGVLGRNRRVLGVSLSPLVAPGTSLWGPRGALGGPPGATTLIGRQWVVTVLALLAR